jgi:hypothetical protein
VIRASAALRAGLVSVVVALTTTTVAAGTAQAHHGFTGQYDASRPLYVQGTVTASTYGYPHGLITIDPVDASPPPDDLTNLSAADNQRLGGRQVVTDATPLQPQGGGTLTLLLPPQMTTTVAGRADRPTEGADVGALVFRECRTGELRVQLLRISAQERVVRTGVVQTEVDGCATDPTARPASPGEAAQSTGVVATDAAEQGGGVSAAVLVGVAVLAGTAAAVAGPVLARRRRRR